MKKPKDNREIVARVRALISEKGMTPRRVSIASGNGPDLIRNWNKRHTIIPTAESLESVAAVLGTTREYLEKGTPAVVPNTGRISDMRDFKKSSIPDIPSAVRSSTDVQAPFSGQPEDVPVFGVTSAGAGAAFYFNGDVITHAPRPRGGMNMRDLYALYVIGDSMSPKYEDGDIVFVNPGRRPRAGDVVIVELLPEDGEKVGRGHIKRLVRWTDTEVEVEQFNPPGRRSFPTNAVKSVHRVLSGNDLAGI